MPSESKSSWFTPFLMVACIALAVVVVLLVRSNKQLKADNAAIAAEAAKSVADMQLALESRSLGPGDKLEDLKLQGIDGMWNPRSFVTSNKHATLVLIASHGCEACSANAASWGAILAGPHPECDAILIYTDGAPTHNDAHIDLPVERFMVNNGKATSLGRIALAPATILVGPDGVIDNVWYGMLDENAMRDIADSIASAPQ